jgi:hypothetical protein
MSKDSADAHPPSYNDTPDESFYFDDSQVYLRVCHLVRSFAFLLRGLQVEQRTYKIHGYFLTRESALFRDMFSLPQGHSSGIEGLVQKQPINIPGTTTSEFECLLRFFYFGYAKVLGQTCL